MESFIKNGYGQGYTHVMHNVQKYYSWKHIIAFIFYNLTLIVVFQAMPETRWTLFAFTLGASSALIFRPFTKRWRYVKLFEMEHSENIPYTPVPEPYASMKFEKHWATEEDERGQQE